jgi:multiple sugar transport system permease protein
VKRVVEPIALVLALVWTLVPIVWMVETSLKSNKEISQDGTLYPHNATLENYRNLFQNHYFGDYLTNSIVVTTASVAISLVCGTLGAYAVARFRLWRRVERRAAVFLLLARIVPAIVIVIPAFLLAEKLSLLNTWTSLIVIYTAFNVSFVVWMMESFFREIPLDLEEAAMVDGDSRMTAFRRVVLPLAAPGMVATAIFAVIVTYNEFLFALTLTATPSAQTMPVGTATLIGRIDIDYGGMAAAGVLGATPIVIFALLVQRHLVRGLTLGAVK